MLPPYYFYILPLSVPGNMQGTLMLLGNSNCFGFIALAASIRISIGFIILSFLTVDFWFDEASELDEMGVLFDLLLLKAGVVCCCLEYMQEWHNHSPLGMSCSSRGGSL